MFNICLKGTKILLNDVPNSICFITFDGQNLWHYDSKNMRIWSRAYACSFMCVRQQKQLLITHIVLNPHSCIAKFKKKFFFAHENFVYLAVVKKSKAKKPNSISFLFQLKEYTRILVLTLVFPLLPVSLFNLFMCSYVHMYVCVCI